MEAIDEEEANKFDEDLFERFQSIHQKIYVNERGEQRSLSVCLSMTIHGHRV